MDQLLMAPIANCLFYIVMAILNGTPFEAKVCILLSLHQALRHSHLSRLLTPQTNLVIFRKIYRNNYGPH